MTCDCTVTAALEAPADMIIAFVSNPVTTIAATAVHVGAFAQQYYSLARGTVEAAINQVAPTLLPAVDAFAAEHASPHVAKLPLMNFMDVLMICIGYLSTIFVLSVLSRTILPKFTMKSFSLIHNLILSSLSLYMFVEVLHQAIIVSGFSLFGNAVDNTAAGFNLAQIIWVFYASKILEFLDTVIMILKKNYRQVSFLHVYHHLSIFPIWWLVTLMAPGGDSYYSAAANSLVHVVMYGYYFLSAIGVNLSVIKLYITSMQMTQFTTMLIQAVYIWVMQPAGYPVLLAQILFFYMISMLALFANFMMQTKRARAAEKKKQAAEKQAAEKKAQEEKEKKAQAEAADKKNHAAKPAAH